jgi:hypothetical protein
VPELAALASLDVAVVLDGELVVGAGHLDDSYGLSARLNGRRGGEPVRFAVFALLWVDGTTAPVGRTSSADSGSRD